MLFPKPQNVLVVIDMQPDFETSCVAELQEAVIKEIKKSKRNKEPIILVEYAGCDDTHLNIRQSLGNYKYHRVRKHRDSGALVLIPLLRKIMSHSRMQFILKVCGVNTGACVIRTVKDIAECQLVKEIKVIWDACHDDWGTHPSLFAPIKNCRVVL